MHVTVPTRLRLRTTLPWIPDPGSSPTQTRLSPVSVREKSLISRAHLERRSYIAIKLSLLSVSLRRHFPALPVSVEATFTSRLQRHPDSRSGVPAVSVRVESMVVYLSCVLCPNAAARTLLTPQPQRDLLCEVALVCGFWATTDFAFSSTIFLRSKV